MLIIRKEQMKVFSAQRAKRFEDRTIAHLREFFPEQTATMADDKLRSVCSYGRERARFHGFEAERDICKYINLMFVFGRDFDKDSRFPWARSILENKTIGPTLRVNRLYLEAQEHEHEGQGIGICEMEHNT